MAEQGVLEKAIKQESKKEGILESEIKDRTGPSPSRRQRFNAFTERHKARREEREEERLKTFRARTERERAKTEAVRAKLEREKTIRALKQERKTLRQERTKLARERLQRFFGPVAKKPATVKHRLAREKMLVTREGRTGITTLPRQRAMRSKKMRDISESREDDGFDFQRDVIG